MIKFISWNVNGIRAAIKKGLRNFGPKWRIFGTMFSWIFHTFSTSNFASIFDCIFNGFWSQNASRNLCPTLPFWPPKCNFGFILDPLGANFAPKSVQNEWRTCQLAAGIRLPQARWYVLFADHRKCTKTQKLYINKTNIKLCNKKMVQ